MLRASLAWLRDRLSGDQDGEDEEPAEPTAFSPLDKSVNEAHGQQGDAGTRAIRQVEATADQLEEIDDHRGPPEGR